MLKFVRPVALGLVPAALLFVTPALAQQSVERLTPFNEFRNALTSASPAQFVGAAADGVGDNAAFEEMRAHLLETYEGVNVRHSFMADDQAVDCIPIMQQPAVRKQKILKIATLPARLPLNDPALEEGAMASQFGPNETRDKFGNAIPCERGTIPMRRMTLNELSRYRNLKEYFQKGPNGAGQIVAPAKRATVKHKYAHALQNVTNFGGVSTMTIWKPMIHTNKNQIFSLSQHWYVAFPSNIVQSAEVGWQNDPHHYGSQNSALFVYWTADGYHNTGCYNLECGAFVQTSNSIVLGGRFTRYSSYNGTQIYVQLGYQYRDGGVGVGAIWTMIFGNSYVGYYPGGLYNQGPAGSNRMSAAAQEIDYGGETVGSTSWPGMGSARFATNNVKRAATHQNIAYFPTFNNSSLIKARLSTQQPSPRCYTLKLHNQTTSSKGTYFYFGGPGGTHC